MIKYSPKNISQKILSWNLFSRKWFCNNKIFRPKTFLLTFRSNIFLEKSLLANPFSRKWFCNNKKISTEICLIKHSTKHFSQKMFSANLFSRRFFGNNKKFSTKKYVIEFTLRVNAFAIILENGYSDWAFLFLQRSFKLRDGFSGGKNWRQNEFAARKIFFALSCFQKKNFTTIKEFGQKNYDQNIFLNFFLETCFRANYFRTIKHFRPKKVSKSFFLPNLFSRK